jgi:hypothetical protein
MALVVKDRVRETSTSTGTGTITLNGAVGGFQSFAVIGDANTTYYTIVDAATGAWEVGIGTYTASGTTLARNTILESSNAGAAVNFVAGTKDVFVTYPAERSVDSDTAQTLTNKTLGSGTAITAGTIDGAVIGATTPSTGAFTTLSSTGNTTLGDAAADTVTINGTPTINAPTTITVNSATNALRITQVGSGNALLVEDSANPDATPFVINSAGQIFAGYTSGVAPDSNNPSLIPISSIFGVNSGSQLAIYSYINAPANQPLLTFVKSRSASIGANSIISSGDTIGEIKFNGDDGVGFIKAASISAQVDGTPGTNDMPGRLVFSTTADGASTLTERMRIDNQGRIGILGAPSSNRRIQVSGATAPAASGFSFGFSLQQTIQSDLAGGQYNAFSTTSGIVATTFSLGSINHYLAGQGTFGAGSAVSNQYGFHASSSLTGATNNYGFYGNIASGTGRWNFYAAGTADNYFAGSVGIGGSPGAGFQLDVQGSGTRSLRAWSTDTTGVTVGNIEAAFGSGGGTSIIRMRAGSGYTSLSSTGASDPLLFSVGGTERMRIASNGTISLGAAPGAESLRVTPVASAVNYWNFQGNTAGNTITTAAQGSDTNISMAYQAKGTGFHFFQTGGGNQFIVSNTASAVNYLQITGSASLFPTLSAQGSGTNVAVVITAKGAENTIFQSGGGTQFIVGHRASAVNYLQTLGGATGNAVTLLAAGSDTNIDLALTPKGTGSVIISGGLTVTSNPVVQQSDIGTAPNEIPLNQYLGNMAFMSSDQVVLNPAASAVPSGIGDMVFELSSDTSLVVKVKGSDGVIRSTTLTLA